MNRFHATLLGTFALPAVAWGGPVVVWLEPQVPGPREVRRAEAMTGPVVHLAHLDLAFPPAPAGQADEAAYEALRLAVVDGRARWQEWDVEAALAATLHEALGAVTVIRSPRDLRDVVDANLLLGAAASRAFPPGALATADEAAPYRLDAPGGPVNRGWYTALALDPERPWVRADIADGAPFEDFSEVRRRVEALPDGAIDLSRVPATAQVFLDGVPVERGTPRVDLRPGEHWFHVVRDGTIAGRSVVVVAPGQEADTPLVVDDAELAEARRQLLDDLTGSFPGDVQEALGLLQRAHRSGVFVAAVADDGKVVVRPYRNAELLGARLVTVVGTGEIGFGMVTSPLFDGSNGAAVSAPGAHGGIGVEVGISHAALLGGFDAALTPTATITYGNADQDDNLSTSVLPQPWGGLGLYVLRPHRPRPTLLLAGTYGFDGPAHMAWGGRVSVGFPIDDEATWFRMTAGAKRAGNVIGSWRSVVGGPVPMSTVYARFGFASRF